MIHEVGNVELCELLDAEPKTQCKACLSYWNVGTVYWTCGHLLQKETEATRKFVKYSMDLLSVPEYVIKKGRPHGHRYGKPVGKLIQQSFGEVPHVKLSKPTQSKPNPISYRSGKPEDTERVFVDKGKTSRSQEIDEKRLHKELASSDRTGKPERLSEDIRVMHAHDGTGEPVKSSESTHTVKEQFVPAEHRDIASFNADNEFNRTTDEENIDFNIPGLPHSAVKRSHDVNVQNLIQKIENHPQRQALQSDLQQLRHFNPFSKESRDVIKAAGHTELCELLDVGPKAQCKVCLSYWDDGIVYCTCGHFLRGTENRNIDQYTIDLLSIPNYYIKKGRPHGHRYGKKPGTTSTSSRIRSRRNARSSTRVSTTGSSATRNSARICLTSVALKNYVVKWTNRRTNITRTTSLQKRLVCTETNGGSVRTRLVPIRRQ